MSDFENGDNFGMGGDTAPARDFAKGGRLVTIEEFYAPDPKEPVRAWHNFIGHFLGGMVGDSRRTRSYYQQFAAESPQLADRLCVQAQKTRKEGIGHVQLADSDPQFRQDIYDAYVIMKKHGANDQELFGFGFESLKD